MRADDTLPHGAPAPERGPQRARLLLLGASARARAAIERALNDTEGVLEAHVRPGTEYADVRYEPTLVDLPELAHIITNAGYSLGGTELRIHVRGLRGAMCANQIEATLRKVPGVTHANIDPSTGTARVRFTPAIADAATVRAAIEAAAHSARLATGPEGSGHAQGASCWPEYASLMCKFWLATALSVALLLLSGLGLHWLHPPYLFTGHPSTLLIHGLSGLSGIATLAVLARCGGHFYSAALTAFRRYATDVNTLIATSSGGAWLYATLVVIAPGIFPQNTAEPLYAVASAVTAVGTLRQALQMRASSPLG